MVPSRTSAGHRWSTTGDTDQLSDGVPSHPAADPVTVGDDGSMPCRHLPRSPPAHAHGPSTCPAFAQVRQPVRCWPSGELISSLEATTLHRLGALVEMPALTGMRRGEVCVLRWSDVDLDHG